MKKSTKGAVAAAAAAVLLLGGAGSLAFWSDSETIGGGTITAGELKLTDTTGADDTCANAAWAFDSSDTESGAYEVGDTIVPGDVLVKECTFDIEASGKHLRASVVPTGGANSGTLGSPDVDVAAAYTVEDVALAGDVITSENNAEELKATIKVTFNYGTNEAGGVSTNDTQEGTVILSGYTLAVTQLHS